MKQTTPLNVLGKILPHAPFLFMAMIHLCHCPSVYLWMALLHCHQRCRSTHIIYVRISFWIFLICQSLISLISYILCKMRVICYIASSHWRGSELEPSSGNITEFTWIRCYWNESSFSFPRTGRAIIPVHVYFKAIKIVYGFTVECCFF